MFVPKSERGDACPTVPYKGQKGKCHGEHDVC